MEREGISREGEGRGGRERRKGKERREEYEPPFGWVWLRACKT